LTFESFDVTQSFENNHNELKMLVSSQFLKNLFPILLALDFVQMILETS